jgi:hypothetical protein
MSRRDARFLLVFTMAALFALPAWARDLHFIGRFGIEGGGDTVASVQSSNGEQNVSAGGLVVLAAGLVYAPPTRPFVIESTIGYKVDNVTGSNGEVKFARWPFELLASYRVGANRFGGGLTYHMSPTYTCSIDNICADSVTLDNALGGVVQYAWGSYEGSWVYDLGLRLTFIDYKAPGGTISGTSIGGFLSFGF